MLLLLLEADLRFLKDREDLDEEDEEDEEEEEYRRPPFLLESIFLPFLGGLLLVLILLSLGLL